MTSDAATPATGSSSMGISDSVLRNAPGALALAQYRAALASLMQRCVERVRSVDLPIDAEPLQAWSADEHALR